MADWTEIVGPALAAVTSPRRLASGTLTLACAGPIALELQHLSGQLAERINAHFGRTLVERFRFVQDATDAAGPRSRPGRGAGRRRSRCPTCRRGRCGTRWPRWAAAVAATDEAAIPLDAVAGNGA